MAGPAAPPSQQGRISVGIISAYKAQADMLERFLEKPHYHALRGILDIKVATVDGFQVGTSHAVL
jgi:superfamily I DNA and/or RNA helicase